MFNPVDAVGDAFDGAKRAAGNVVGGVQEAAGDVVDGVQQIAREPVATVAGVLGLGPPSGRDGGSSNWSAWDHEEIRAMLDTTVFPDQVGEAAHVWRELQENAADIITRLTRDLRGIVSEGWQGVAADAAVESLRPVEQSSAALAGAVEHTANLIEGSGSAAAQAKATVPPFTPHDWGRSLTGFGRGGPGFAMVDAVAQYREQQAARAEAVRIMTNVYSVPINDNRAVIPVYPQIADPTLQPPEPHLPGGPSPGAGHAGPGAAGAGSGAAAGGAAYQPPTAAGLQGLAGGSAGSPTAGQSGPGRLGGPPQPVGPGRAGPGGGVPAADVPLPVRTAGAGAGADHTRRGLRGVGTAGGRPGGFEGRAAGSPGGGPGFGPRGSGAGVAGVADGRLGPAPGGVAGTAARGGVGGIGGVPMAGAGRGPGGADTEHHRPSYLIEMDDVFSDGRKVAPPVIGEDPPGYPG